MAAHLRTEPRLAAGRPRRREPVRIWTTLTPGWPP